MGIFGHTLNIRSRSTTPTEPPQRLCEWTDENCHSKYPLSRNGSNFSTLINSGNNNKGRLPQIRRILLKQQANTPNEKFCEFTTSNSTVGYFTTVDDWNNENDEVTLLSKQQEPTIDSILPPNEGEICYTSKALSRESSHKLVGSEKLSKRSARQAILSSSCKSRWDRKNVPSMTLGSIRQTQEKNVLQSKRLKKEHEIKFECFLEDDEINDIVRNDHLAANSISGTRKSTSKGSLFRRTAVLQSWWTHSKGLVKWGSTASNSKSHSAISPVAANSVCLNYGVDCDSQEEIIFRSDSHYERTSLTSNVDARHESDTESIYSNQNWELELPVQLHIPIMFESIAWGNDSYTVHNNSDNLNYSNIGVSLV